MSLAQSADYNSSVILFKQQKALVNDGHSITFIIRLVLLPLRAHSSSSRLVIRNIVAFCPHGQQEGNDAMLVIVPPIASSALASLQIPISNQSTRRYLIVSDVQCLRWRNPFQCQFAFVRLPPISSVFVQKGRI